MKLRTIPGLLLLALISLVVPTGSSAQVAVGISVHIGPPALPVYVQPVCPAPGYIWTPGYWAYGPDGYYWVPGTWVLAPTPGYLWTPGYWGWGGGVYVWHAGYWGPHVGFYGGINYGYGYGGVGFVGGEWRGGVFHYNTAVTNVNTTVIHNTYINKTLINRTTVNNVSYNGGAGGITARPTREELAAEHDRHVAATSLQTQHEQTARGDRSMLASENHGRPAIAATAHPGQFHGQGVVAARSAGSNGNRPNSFANNSVRSTDGHGDRPPNAHANGSFNRNNANQPNAAAQNSSQRGPQNSPNGQHPPANNVNGNRPNNGNGNANHQNSPRPPQQNHQQPPKEHENNGHPGGRPGR
ncbi:MAG TPA: YXWGXW repeat-containing protein [Candidatus Acidoferrum sp.]|nr:YXWGXW repeat-containing protein [Candidatus Acidoferrum sp.]